MLRPLDDAETDVLIEAATRARQQIDQDMHRTDGKTRHMLGAIRDRLLDPAINVSVLARELGFEPNTLSPSFHAALGTTPWAYIQDRRFEVAIKLMRRTALPVWRVGMLIGYPNLCTFSRAFKRRLGATPTRLVRTRQAPATLGASQPGW